MSKRCFIPGCRTGHYLDVAQRKREGKKNPSVFLAPKDAFLFLKWKEAISRADKSLGFNNHVCELHFREEDIETYFETKLFNGNIHRILRSHKKLKPGVIPSIFPSVPERSSYAVNLANKLKVKYVKRKKKLHSSNITSKKAKVSCPEKENILMEVIVVHPLPKNSSNKQPSHAKERKSAKESIKPSFSGSDYLEAITVSPSKQNLCNKILPESPTTDKLTVNCIDQCSSITSTIKSHVSDTPIKYHSEQNSSEGTITESSVPPSSKERYSEQKVRDVTMTEYPAKDAASDDYSNECYDDNRTMNEFDNRTMNEFDNRTMNEFDNQTMNEFDNRTMNEFSSDSDVKPIICDKIKTEPNNVPPEPGSEEHTSFDFLKANLNMFDTTNSWWRVNTYNDFILFSRCTPDYSVERRIVITKDLDVKVFLLEKETAIGLDKKKFTIYDIAKLIYKVENLKLCNGVDKKNENCLGFLQHALKCVKHNMCLNCIKWKKREGRKQLNG